MSKKTNKILLVAIIALLVISMVALVACGGGGDDKKTEDTGNNGGNGGGGSSETTATLDGNKAMANFTKDFAKAAGTKDGATATETITVGGLDLNLANLIQIKIDNVTIDLTRSYKSGVLNIDAKIYDLKISIPKGLSMVMGFIPKDGIWVDTDGDGVNEQVVTKDELNIDTKTLANLNNVSLETSLSIDKDMIVNVSKFSIKGLDKVKDSKNKILGVLKRYQLDKAIVNVDALVGNPVDPWNDPNPDDKGEKDEGIFTQMNNWCNNLAGGTAGDTLSEYLTDNYKMLTLYDFAKVEVKEGNKISYKGAADFSKVYATAQSILDEYSTNEISALNTTVSGLLTSIFDTDQVTDILSAGFITMGDAAMTGEYTQDGKNFNLSKMTTTQSVKIDIEKDFIYKVLDLVVTDKDLLGTIKGAAGSLLEKGIHTKIDVKTVGSFVY